jgi:hypothetical protein
MIDLLWAVQMFPVLQESICRIIHIGLGHKSVAMNNIERELLSTKVGDLKLVHSLKRAG